MVRVLLIAAVFLVGVGLMVALRSEKPSELQTVESVDLERYMGEWYSIASIPQFFSKQCYSGTRAIYRLREAGSVEVTNQCITESGELNEVKGTAWLPDKNEPGKLRVSFVSFLGLNLFGADYWIIELDEDYQYAVVGHPSRKYGWILSRTPKLSQPVLSDLIFKLESVGYDFSKFRMEDQSVYY